MSVVACVYVYVRVFGFVFGCVILSVCAHGYVCLCVCVFSVCMYMWLCVVEQL